MTLAQEVKRLRTAAKLSQYELAKAVRVSPLLHCQDRAIGQHAIRGRHTLCAFPSPRRSRRTLGSLFRPRSPPVPPPPRSWKLYPLESLTSQRQRSLLRAGKATPDGKDVSSASEERLRGDAGFERAFGQRPNRQKRAWHSVHRIGCNKNRRVSQCNRALRERRSGVP
jgi:hypothetical protein